ncbi:structural maintenance of chromosomes flexible hinge domain-containing protein 1 isoform X2 [Notolabrus celidotus]|uniref:structural maintenance of chromosomes flexible hinge domain-containing protein 1 isoform X2 n=1 Tax=Notolabrus celidotus TaxID=1203425 RepID=UPI00148FC95C|nr:structural maintenance of chromosomes flexible hinge domain-containing protein 1 isoform X2 [Notolabrus celidotus]
MSHPRSQDKRLSGSIPRDERVRRRICVYDRRYEKQEHQEEWMETAGLDYNDFLRELHKKFSIFSVERYVLTTTDRTLLDFDKFEKLQDLSTLNLLQSEDQPLQAATEELISFTPHYNTLTESGRDEYYYCEGKVPLTCAFAELIDNSLTATKDNGDVRTIEIRMLFDELLGENAIIILDNGCGMSSLKLRNWATYRLNKFDRKEASEQEGYVRPPHVRRSLNSDVSYFGVGGKNASFFIGESIRMITKSKDSPDVHELTLSKKSFENKEKNQEDVFREFMKNRKPGDASHVVEPFLRDLIREETRLMKESFTAVVITEVKPEHVIFLKNKFEVVARQLAHIYHYYIHGVNGNIPSSSSSSNSKSDDLSKVDILLSGVGVFSRDQGTEQVTLREKAPRCPREIHLKEVDDDMQTLYLNSAADTFEFEAVISADSYPVEGIIRYHPFLFDSETYPQDPDIVQASNTDEDGINDEESGAVARGKRAIFDCYWNGRLIPNNGDFEFDWCTRQKRSELPVECYNRFSGVLFTSSNFKVNTSKLSFVDLELILKKKNVIFDRVVNGKSKRSIIEKDFTNWLRDCHKKHDKQIKFMDYKETITRTDVPTKKLQHPWETFGSIEWHGKIYSAGQLVKSQKTQPIVYGRILRFMRYGETEKKNGCVFTTGGEVELDLEPKALHNKKKTIPISKIDKTVTDEFIKMSIDSDSIKLPAKLRVSWPESEPWPEDAVRPAGTPLGPLKVEILNKKGDPSPKMPPSAEHKQGRPLVIELKLVYHGPRENQVVISYIAKHTKWDFWFKCIELTKLGKYTLFLTTQIQNNSSNFGGEELPRFQLSFSIKEGAAQKFNIGTVSHTIKVGVPFDIPLHFKDGYDHSAAPPDLKPVLKCSGLDLSYETVNTTGSVFTIRGVTVRGKVQNYQQSKSYDLKVTLPGLKDHTQSFTISLLPGNPHFLHIIPEDDPITVENGQPVRFDVEVHDEAGNITANPKQIVQCEVDGLPLAEVNCSSTGAGQIVTKPINLKITSNEPQILKAQFELSNKKNFVALVRNVKVVPSRRVFRMELLQDDMNLVLKNKDKIEWLAGGSLENLFYKLYDEADREVLLSEEIAARIKVTWKGEVNLEDLIQGKLPDLKVPTKAHGAQYYQVSYQDQSVSVSFEIMPHPDGPAKLKVTIPQNTVRLGEALPENIILELVDQYNNPTAALNPTCVKDMTVEAEGLDKSALEFTWQEDSSTVSVSGVQFQSGTPGSRELCFTYKNFEERVLVKVTPGIPAELKFVSKPEMPLQVFSEHGIATPFIVQLYDKWGNISTDQRVIVELKTSPPNLKVLTPFTSQPVNIEGKAPFTINSVSGTKGYYQLIFKGSFNGNSIPGPSVDITVIPDPEKPVKLVVDFTKSAKFLAGGKFPVFSVTVMSEEGNRITNFSPGAVSMSLWSGAPSGGIPPQSAVKLTCSKPLETDETDCYYFRDKEIPELAGMYTIQFILLIEVGKVLRSDQISINVEANQPVILRPVSEPPNPVVSYCSQISNRTLVEDMTLMIMDSHGNPTRQDLNGKVLVSIQSSSEVSRNLPLFEGRTSRCQINLVKGKAHIGLLTIMENSPGDNGCSYVLLFKPDVSGVTLEPFELPFHFYNDVENQQRITELSKKKAELNSAIDTFKNVFKMYDELLSLQTGKVQDAEKKESIMRTELISKKLIEQQNVNMLHVDQLLKEKEANAQQIWQGPRRVCKLRDPFKGQQDVLGMVGHLAYVSDDSAARVISWHIRGDMDCVVTRNGTTAKMIYDSTNGNQQVMSLTSVLVPPGNRPLPHMRSGHPLFDPPGNPVLARSLLQYTHEDRGSCEKVFKNVLGDTILIDDLTSGNSYREQLVERRIPCPTILTRQGERIGSRGKFGGAQNRAPQNVSPVFGARLPQQFNTLKEQIELLKQYKSLIQKKEEAKKEFEDQFNLMNSPETLTKRQDMDKKIKELAEIDRQIVSSPVRPVKRGPEQAGEPSGINTKRVKLN